MERYFPEKSVHYISLLDGIDTGVESTANITPLRTIMNDMYAKGIPKKIKSGKRDKQRKGQFIGSKPKYGYKVHPTEKKQNRYRRGSGSCCAANLCHGSGWYELPKDCGDAQ